MRWTDEGAHCMAQVRVAVLNGKFSPRRISALEIAAPRHGKCIGAASLGRHRPTNRTDRATMPHARRPDEIGLPNFCTLSSAANPCPLRPTIARSV